MGAKAMGLRIYAVKPRGALPRKVVLELTCDGQHGFVPPTPQVFSSGGFVRQFSDAMSAGWKETFNHGERRFLGPCCSGKRSAA